MYNAYIIQVRYCWKLYIVSYLWKWSARIWTTSEGQEVADIRVILEEVVCYDAYYLLRNTVIG